MSQAGTAANSLQHIPEESQKQSFVGANQGDSGLFVTTACSSKTWPVHKIQLYLVPQQQKWNWMVEQK